MMILAVLFAAISAVSRAKQFVLLPYNSVLCSNSSRGVHQYQEFTINQQINLHTQSNINEVGSVIRSVYDNGTNAMLWPPPIEGDKDRYYLCRALVKPMGRPLEFHNEMGKYSFWNVRIRIDRLPGILSCNDHLLLQFRYNDYLVTKLEGHSASTVNITCQTNLPIVIPSSLRKLYLTYFSFDLTNPGYVLNVTSFILFDGSFSLEHQQQFCRKQDGFWCVNNTVCIYRELKCDGLDSCFDGGSDEVECTNSENFTIPVTEDKRSKSRSGFIDYLPWLALGILPLILLLALICICNQHRSEVYFDEEEDNLDLEKSHDGDDMWSSVDGLEKDTDDVDEDCQLACSEDHDQDAAINLVTFNTHQETTKADISSSRTFQSLNKDYDDIDHLPTTSATITDQTERMNHLAEDPLEPGCQANGVERKQNIMYTSQMTDDDYEDRLEDVGSLLRKVDKSRIPEEVRLTSLRPSFDTTLQPETGAEYRSDYILV